MFKQIYFSQSLGFDKLISQGLPSLVLGLRLCNTFLPTVSIFLFRCSINFLLYLLI